MKINLIAIAEGLINLGKKGMKISNSQVEQLAEKRIKECLVCKEYDPTNTSCKLPFVEGCCKLCGCHMKTKVRVLDIKCADTENPKW